MSTPTEKKGQTNGAAIAPVPHSWWQPYWQLARMHKFPAGSMLVFWPCGEWQVVDTAIYVDQTLSLGLPFGRSQQTNRPIGARILPDDLLRR